MSILYKNIENRTQIKTCVRLNKLNQLELFYYCDNELNSFTYAEGHNIACLEYMYSCKLVDKETAEAFILSYNNNYNDDVIHVYSKRLYK